MAKKKRKPNQLKNRNYHPQEPSGENIKSFESLTRQKFKDMVRSIKDRGGLEPKVIDGLDFDAAHQKRRLKAIIATLDEVKSLVSKDYAEITGYYTIAEEWAEVNTYPIAAYDFEEPFTFSVTAAAIWILDQIKEAGRISELMYILKPPDDRVNALLPPVWDMCHSRDVIESTVETIFFRNESGKYQRNSGKVLRPYMSESITAGEVDHESPNRSAFDQVLALIPEHLIQSAISKYEDRYWELVLRYFKSRYLLLKKEIRCNERIDAIKETLQGVIDQVNRPVTQKALVTQSPRYEPQETIADLFSVGQSFSQKNALLDPTNPVAFSVRISSELDQLDREQDQLNDMINDLRLKCGFFSQMDHKAIENEYGAEIADIWNPMDMGDPYEMCFAFLYLLDSGSDLPWCYFAGVNLHTAYASLLPWPRNRFDVFSDGVWYHTDPQTGETLNGPDPEPIPKRIRIPEPEDWLEMKYSDSPDRKDLYSLSQIIYEATGCIMPRRLDRYNPAAKILDRYGISGKRELRPLMYCMSLLGEARNQTQPFYTTLEFIPDEEDEEIVNEVAIDDLRTQLAALREENKKLKQQAYDSGREVRDQKERYEALAQRAANEAQELNDLRELVFNRSTVQSEHRAPNVPISFPYVTNRRVIVFGGHDSWSKEMKPKFPDVRFIDRDMLPNPDLIRKADMVWIQPNALSHAHYYKIIDEARKYNIRVRYFSYASPMKCAVQIIQDDKDAR